jgi:hypothetical protein
LLKSTFLTINPHKNSRMLIANTMFEKAKGKNINAGYKNSIYFN